MPRAKGKPGRPKKDTAGGGTLVARMDTFADQLLNECNEGKITLETRLAAFAHVTKWVHVRNRLTDSQEDGALLDEYKSTLDGAAREIAARADGTNRALAALERANADRVVRPSAGDVGGAELEALKSRIPVANDGDNGSHRASSRGAGVVDAGPIGLVRSQHIGNVESDLDEPGDRDEF